MFALVDNRFLCAVKFKTMRRLCIKFRYPNDIQNIVKF